MNIWRQQTNRILRSGGERQTHLPLLLEVEMGVFFFPSAEEITGGLFSPLHGLELFLVLFELPSHLLIAVAEIG